MVVNQSLVAQVQDDPEPASRGFRSERARFVFGEQGAGRIAGRVDDDGPGTRRDGREKMIGAQPEAVVLVRADDHGRAAGQLDLLNERRPARHVRDDLIARPDEREGRVQQRLLAARRDDDFVRGIADPVVGPVACADGLPQVGDAHVGGVLREIAGNRGVGRLGDVMRGGEVGLAGAEVDDIDPLAAQPFGLDRPLHRRGHPHLAHAIGEPSGIATHAGRRVAGRRPAVSRLATAGGTSSVIEPPRAAISRTSRELK